jgi:5-methylcytosine-specific restriction endonuclease McrA
MKAPRSPQAFAKCLRKLHDRRRKRTIEFRTHGRNRSALTPNQRNEILSKTGNRCHVCGIKIKKTESWHADHVLPHSGGGKSVIDNYLPSCALCNRNRWHMLPEEIQAVLKLVKSVCLGFRIKDVSKLKGTFLIAITLKICE